MPRSGGECRQGPEWGPVTTGRHSPERPLSPPQGQRWPQWAPQPFAPAAAEAPCHQRHRFCPGPRHRPPAVGSGMGLGAVGAKAMPPARPLPPMQSARPVPWLGPHPLPSPCQETPASTVLHLCLCHHPPSPLSPPQPLPAPRLCAGPVAGTSSAWRPAFLFSCNSSHQWAATAQKSFGSLGLLLLGRGPSPAICRFPFD